MPNDNTTKSSVHSDDVKGFFFVVMIIAGVIGTILAVAVSVIGTLITAGFVPAVMVVLGWVVVIVSLSLLIIGDGSVRKGLSEVLRA